MDLLLSEVETMVNESKMFLDDFDADVASQLTGKTGSKKSKKPPREKYPIDEAIVSQVNCLY